MYALKENEEVTSGQTTLEEAIDVLDYIAHAFTRLEVAELKELQLCLRCYAVIAPLRKDNRNTAKVCRLVTVLFTVHALFLSIAGFGLPGARYPSTSVLCCLVSGIGW